MEIINDCCRHIKGRLTETQQNCGTLQQWCNFTMTSTFTTKALKKKNRGHLSYSSCTTLIFRNRNRTESYLWGGENHREDDTIVLLHGIRWRHKHRLWRVETFLVPDLRSHTRVKCFITLTTYSSEKYFKYFIVLIEYIFLLFFWKLVRQLF